jgi:hypothetical protein
MSSLIQVGSENLQPQISPLEIAVAVVLGNPQYEDCSQHGICRVDRLNDYEPCNCPHQMPAILKLGAKGIESLVFQIINMARETWEKHFGSDQFRIDACFCFSSEFMKSVNRPGTLCIEQGFYPLQKSEERIEILFQ